MSIPPSYLAIGMGGHFEGFVGCGESQASRETAMFVSLPALRVSSILGVPALPYSIGSMHVILVGLLSSALKILTKSAIPKKLYKSYSRE